MRAAVQIVRVAARAAAAPRAAVPRALPSALPSSSAIASSSVRGFSTTPTTLKKATKKDAKKAGDNKKGGKKKAEAEEEEGGLSEAQIDAIVKKTDDKMTKSLDWAKSVLFEGVERGRGRVSPGAFSLFYQHREMRTS